MLHFKELVTLVFDQIMQKYHMQCTYLTNQEIIYSNEKIMIKILFDQSRSYELNMLFEHKDFNKHFDIYQFLRYKKLIDDKDNGAIMIVDGIVLMKFLRKFATEIFYEENIFNEIDNFNTKQIELYAISKKVSCSKKLAYDAWQEKEYQKVIEFYSDIMEYLTESEIKKLNFARKHT